MEWKNINDGKIDRRAICSNSAIKQLESSMKSEHANIYQYKIAQLTILKMLSNKFTI